MAVIITGNTMTRFNLVLLYLCLALGYINTATADTVVLFETNNPRTPDTIHIKDSKIRLSNAQDPIVTLFDYKSKKLTMLNQDDKTYYQITEKGLKKVVRKLKQLQTELKQGLNPKQQAQLDKVFKKQGLAFNSNAAHQSVKKVKSSNIKGIDCDVYVTLINKQVNGTHCIASGRYIGINSVDFRTYLHLMYFLKQISFGLNNVDPAMQNGFTGMPLVSYDAKGNVMSKFISVSSHNIDKQLFTIPSEYSKTH